MEIFPCKICGEKFQNEVSLIFHFSKLHFETSEDSSDDEKGVVVASARKKPGSDLTSVQKVGKTKPSRRSRGSRTLLPRFECIFCESTFADNCDFEYHIRSHTQEKPYFCLNCDQCFSRPNYLTKHLKLHTGFTEDELNRHTCPQCGKGFRTSFRMKEHVVVHTGDKPYKCDQCGKEYTHGENLKRHKRIHTGERPFVCSVCEKGFNTPSTLKIHMRCHTLERPYKCEECDASFRQKHHLNDHIKTHSKAEFLFGCPKCSKCFPKLSSLKNHARSCKVKVPEFHDSVD